MRLAAQTDEYTLYSELNKDLKNKSRNYREIENLRRTTAGAGLLLKQTYRDVIAQNERYQNHLFRSMRYTDGITENQRMSIEKLQETLKEIQTYVQHYCEQKHVTVTADFVFVAPMSVIAQRTGVDVRTASGYIKLLCTLGFLQVVDTWRFGIPFIGNCGIRSLLYRLPRLTQRVFHVILSRWQTWVERNGAVHRISRAYLREVFGSRIVDPLYVRPEAYRTDEAKRIREENMAMRTAEDYWANNTDYSISRRHSEYRRVRGLIQNKIKYLLSHSSEPVIEDGEMRTRGIITREGEVRRVPVFTRTPCNERRVVVGSERMSLTFDQIHNVSKMLTLLDKHYDRETFVEVCKKQRWFKTSTNFSEQGYLSLRQDEINRTGVRDDRESLALAQEACTILFRWFPGFARWICTDLFGVRDEKKEQVEVSTSNSDPGSEVTDCRNYLSTMNRRERALELVWQINCSELDYTTWMSVMTAAKSAGCSYDDLHNWCMTDPTRCKRWDRSAFRGYRTDFSMGVLVNASKNFAA